MAAHGGDVGQAQLAHARVGGVAAHPGEHLGGDDGPAERRHVVQRVHKIQDSHLGIKVIRLGGGAHGVHHIAVVQGGKDPGGVHVSFSITAAARRAWDLTSGCVLSTAASIRSLASTRSYSETTGRR